MGYDTNLTNLINVVADTNLTASRYITLPPSPCLSILFPEHGSNLKFQKDLEFLVCVTVIDILKFKLLIIINFKFMESSTDYRTTEQSLLFFVAGLFHLICLN